MDAEKYVPKHTYIHSAGALGQPIKTAFCECVQGRMTTFGPLRKATERFLGK
jgi:hypothetical protein